MAAVLPPKAAAGRAPRLEWLLVALGLGVLYVPVFENLAAWHWRTDDGGHGPIVLAVVAWLTWRRRAVLVAPAERPARAAGYALLLPGLFVYVLGRSHQIALFEISALVPILAGVVLAMRGREALRVLWFPLVFVAFMVPLPGVFVDSLTGPLKHQVSQIAEHILYAAGYPVARSGVLIMIGPYQLLVADACAGLHSMFSLSALGLLYMYLTARLSLLHNAIMLASILPIAFAANVVRVLLLMLITYHFGDAAGQGFLHGATGMVLLLVALAGLIALDAGLARLLGTTRSV
jgi:exosortase B